MRLVLLKYCIFLKIFIDAVKSELLTLIFQSDCEDLSSYQTITLLLQRKRFSKLRFTPLVTIVYLSHPSSPTFSRNLSSNSFPKCVKSKRCFIFLQDIKIGNDTDSTPC